MGERARGAQTCGSPLDKAFPSCLDLQLTRPSPHLAITLRAEQLAEPGRHIQAWPSAEM